MGGWRAATLLVMLLSPGTTSEFVGRGGTLARVAIRVDGDAGREAGMGHVYRSMAYARLLLGQVPGAEIQFFMRGFPEGLAKVREEGFPVHPLPVHPIQADYEIAFGTYLPNLLIIDLPSSYPQLKTAGLMTAGRQFAGSIIMLDDVGPTGGEADVIVNGILWATRWLPERVGGAKVYQGVEYMPLREQFAVANQRPRKVSPQVEEIIISTGGADGRGFATQLMGALQHLSFKCHVNVMVGPAYTNSAEVKDAAEHISGRAQFSVVDSAPNMADYLMAADVALVTGGTVMFESAACGTPAVVVCSYEPQVPQAQWFHQQGTAVNLGYFAETVDQERVARAVEELASQPLRRQEMSIAGKKLVDGQGLYRFVEIIKSQL